MVVSIFGLEMMKNACGTFPTIFVIVSAIFSPISMMTEDSEETTPFPSASNDDSCTPIHSRAWGMTLACCGPSAPLPRDCKYNTVHLCTYVSCTCALFVDMDKVNCADNVAVAVWKDHDVVDHDGPFLCRNPNFPNAEAEFSATLHFGAKFLRSEFYLGLSRYRIIELEISFQTVNEMPEHMFTYFRLVKRLKIWQQHLSAISTMNRQNSAQRRLFASSANLPASFATLKHLEMITMQNISNLLLPETVAFAETLRYIQIYNCGLKKLPDFLKTSSRLEYMKITHTNLSDIQLVGKLNSLKLCFLSHNKIRDLTDVQLENRLLRDLDLSYNQISILSPDTFIGLVSLTFLDLSNNYLKRLPNGLFTNLKELKWLYLNHDFSPTKMDVGQKSHQQQQWKTPRSISLDYLSAQHFVGLSNLEYLSLANNPGIKFDSTTFSPLDNLLSLDLKHCNLSSIPETLTHLCQLKYLWLNFNNLQKDVSYPPQIFVHLTQRLDEMDLNENSIDENARSFFLVPSTKITLMESLLFALKQQSVWFNDHCASYHWWLHLIDSTNSNLNQTLKTYYQRKFALTSNQTLSPYEKQLCKASYMKIVRDLKPFSKMSESGACFRLVQEKAVNHQLRRQLVQLSRSKQANSLNVASSVENLLLDNNDSSSTTMNFGLSSNVECNQTTKTDRRFNKTRRGDETNGGDDENCRYLYDNVNLLGYLLAANFAVLLIVCLCCVITFCKRQSSSTRW